MPIDDSDQPWIVTYTLGPSGRIRIGDSAEYKCRDDNYSIKKGEIRTCLPGGGWNILEEPECGKLRLIQTDFTFNLTLLMF